MFTLFPDLIPPKPAKRSPKTISRLKGDYGVEFIDGEVDDGICKNAFHKEARAYLEELRVLLGAEKTYQDGKNKNHKAIYFNPGGPGVGGDMRGILFALEATFGIDITLCTLTPGTVKGSPSGVSIVWRICEWSPTTKSLKSHRNRWEDFDISLERLAEKMRQALERGLAGDLRAENMPQTSYTPWYYD